MPTRPERLEALHERLVGVMTSEVHALRVEGDEWGLAHPMKCRTDMLGCPVRKVLGGTGLDFMARVAEGTYRLVAEGDMGFFVYEAPDPVVSELEGILADIEGLIAEEEG